MKQEIRKILTELKKNEKVQQKIVEKFTIKKQEAEAKIADAEGVIQKIERRKQEIIIESAVEDINSILDEALANGVTADSILSRFGGTMATEEVALLASTEEKVKEPKKEKTKREDYKKVEGTNGIYAHGDQYSMGIYNGVHFEVAHNLDALTVYAGKHEMKEEIYSYLKKEVYPEKNFNLRIKRGLSFESEIGRIHEISEGKLEGYVLVKQHRTPVKQYCFVWDRTHADNMICIANLEERFEMAKQGNKIKFHKTTNKKVYELAHQLLEGMLGGTKIITKEEEMEAARKAKEDDLKNYILTEEEIAAFEKNPMEDTVRRHKAGLPTVQEIRKAQGFYKKIATEDDVKKVLAEIKKNTDELDNPKIESVDGNGDDNELKVMIGGMLINPFADVEDSDADSNVVNGNVVDVDSCGSGSVTGEEEGTDAFNEGIGWS